MIPINFTDRLLSWYAHHKRALPWRTDQNAYKIWLSEIILQQTRVSQGLPYYKRFIQSYPTVHDLAAASEQEVLHLWQGLGYYSRARNLHRCSRYIVDELAGIFPTTYEGLLQLPGVGPYTAAAIASIAFGERVAVVDGNVYRVLARIFGVEEDISSHAGKKHFQALATALMPSKEVGSYNQALMEFGALHCTPQQPLCTTCPFQTTCIAYKAGKQGELPVKNRRTSVRDRYFYYLLIHFQDQLYVRQRVEKDIWHGLYDFYLIESDTAASSIEALEDPLLVHSKKYNLTPTQCTFHTRHQLSHQRLHIQFFHLHATEAFIHASTPLLHAEGMQLHAADKLHELPFPRAIHRFFESNHSKGLTPSS